MTKQLHLGQRKFFLLCLLLFVTLVVVAPAFAQQNGTTCANSFENGPDTMYLSLDSVCLEWGDPWHNPENPYPGYGSHDGCYSSNNGYYGMNASCDPCPSNWQNCTPCNNYENNCGADTPDPPPVPVGSNQAPRKIRNAAYALWSTIDWLTS